MGMRILCLDPRMHAYPRLLFLVLLSHYCGARTVKKMRIRTRMGIWTWISVCCGVVLRYMGLHGILSIYKPTCVCTRVVTAGLMISGIGLLPRGDDDAACDCCCACECGWVVVGWVVSERMDGWRDGWAGFYCGGLGSVLWGLGWIFGCGGGCECGWVVGGGGGGGGGLGFLYMRGCWGVGEEDGDGI